MFECVCLSLGKEGNRKIAEEDVVGGSCIIIESVNYE